MWNIFCQPQQVVNKCQTNWHFTAPKQYDIYYFSSKTCSVIHWWGCFNPTVLNVKNVVGLLNMRYGWSYSYKISVQNIKSMWNCLVF